MVSGSPQFRKDVSAVSPMDVLADAFSRFEAGQISISFSGAEDVVLIEMAFQLLGNDVRVFSLDTGRLHPETYRYINEVRNHYGISIDMLSPDPANLEQLVREKGLFSFYQDGHQECCSIRKIQPLKRHLSHLDAWITGQRRDQSVTRSELPKEQQDSAFSTPDHPITKFNPLTGWTSADVWRYVQKHSVPYNPLHDRGYASIGCEPCTRSVTRYQHERDGRWWWEDQEDKECGLHAQNADVQPIRVIDKYTRG
ncbi:MAG: phosphoadenylyl-sulfate reductase [Pseudomonadales bacterium]